MLRSLSLLIVSVPIPSTYAQELKVYLNTDDCINCTAALSQMQSLDTAIGITIYADEAKKRFIPEALERFGIAGNPRMPVVYIPTKDLVAVAAPSSECVFKSKGCSDQQFPLKEIGLHVRDMNAFARNYGQKNLLPFSDSLTLSDRCNLFAGDGHAVITDYVLGKAYRIELDNDRTAQVHQLDIPDSFTREYLKAIGLSLARYDSLGVILSNSGKRKPDIRSASFHGDTIQTYVSISYPGFSPQDSTYVMMTSYPAFVFWVDGKIVGWRQCDYTMPDTLNYYLDASNSFHLSDRALTSPLVEIPRTSGSPWLLGEYGYVDHSIRFTRMLNAHVPRSVRTEGRKDVSYRVSCNKGLFSLSCYPYFFDVPTGKSFDLSKTFSKGKKNFFFEKEQTRYWTEDARWMDDGTLMVLYYRNKVKELAMAWIDVGTGGVIRRLLLSSGDMITGSLRILDDGRVVGLYKDYNGLVVLN